MRRGVIGLAAILVVVVLYVMLRDDDHAAAEPPAAVASLPPQPSLAVPAARPVAAATPVTTPRPLPRSLAGTEITGGLAVDASGHLVLDENVRRFFDYFLTALGEETIDQIRARIEAEIAARLPPGAAAEARDLLHRYLAFRAKAERLDGTKTDLATRVAEIRALRRAEMGDEAATKLFASADALTDVELERRRIAAQSLSDDERARQLAEAEQRVPEPLRVIREATMAPVVSMQHEEALRQSGASPDDIQAYRTATFGPEAAARLADLDNQRADWQARLDGFRAERAKLEATISDEADRDRELSQLLDAEFSPPERIRVAALERIAEHPLPFAP